MTKKRWKALFILIPILMTALTFHYLTVIVRQYEDMVFDAVKHYRVETTRIFAENIDRLVERGISWDENQDLYDSMVHWYVDSMSVSSFTYITIKSPYFDADLEQYAIGKMPGVGSFDLLECEENLGVVLDATAEANTGFIEVNIGGAQRLLYYHAIPLENTEYWIFIGVNRELLLATFDFTILKIPMLIVGLLFTVSLMDSIWQRMLRIRNK